ncbi:MAG: pH regulation protein D, partial [Bacteroidota bacterium]|nr:pH regulation protein D [Bacteroidota bacterium]
MILPALLLIPFLYIILAILIKSKKVKTWLSLAFSLINLGFAIWVMAQVFEAGMIKTQMGSWPAPFGITLVADRFSAFMLLVSALVFAVVTLYSIQSVDTARIKNGYFLFAHGILMGVNGSFLAGDLFNLY